MPNLKGVTKEVWVRIVVLLSILLNQIGISLFGFKFLPFEDEEIYEGVSITVTIIVVIWTSWKNNSITREAQIADGYLENLRESREADRDE